MATNNSNNSSNNTTEPDSAVTSVPATIRVNTLSRGQAKKTTSSKPELTDADVQQRGFCNWCRSPMQNQYDPITDANWVDTNKKIHPNDGENALALFCNECLNFPERVANPKAAIDRATLVETDMSNLVE